MTQQRRALGALGEELAARYLAREGYRIVARNVRAGGVELDLVVERGRICAFVEVKTRRSRSHGPPEAAVDARKQQRLARGAAAWLREQRVRRARRVRFDVIAVEPGAGGGWQLRHWPGAFDQPGGAGA
ncbi:MAG: YraN family protein [Deltaproteobacteria bacterium]|nr:YraN family protein [Deltaproteobacteria bacterium]